MGQQIVAQQHAGLVVPAGVDGVEMPPHRGLVEHVVVNQRGRMDQLDRRP